AERKSPGDPGKEAPKQAPTPSPKTPRGLPQPRADGARALDKPPQTAEDKTRQLSDLYAQLAAAENEAEAKKLAGAIERLWRHSGSDTVNLLVSRAAKVAAEKRGPLAEKLLDRAVALAPDYTEGFSQRAFFHYSQNNPVAAAGDLRRVLALDPNHFRAMEGLVQIWRDAGNKKAAYEVLKQLIEVHPFAAGAKQAFDELRREVEGRGI
ncbi:MAG: tetratricopeptide repeat protein, partial [Hyphomicrobiaceae bacterium]